MIYPIPNYVAKHVAGFMVRTGPCVNSNRRNANPVRSHRTSSTMELSEDSGYKLVELILVESPADFP